MKNLFLAQDDVHLIMTKFRVPPHKKNPPEALETIKLAFSRVHCGESEKSMQNLTVKASRKSICVFYIVYTILWSSATTTRCASSVPSLLCSLSPLCMPPSAASSSFGL